MFTSIIDGVFKVEQISITYEDRFRETPAINPGALVGVIVDLRLRSLKSFMKLTCTLKNSICSKNKMKWLKCKGLGQVKTQFVND